MHVRLALRSPANTLQGQRKGHNPLPLHSGKFEDDHTELFSCTASADDTSITRSPTSSIRDSVPDCCVLANGAHFRVALRGEEHYRVSSRITLSQLQAACVRSASGYEMKRCRRTCRLQRHTVSPSPHRCRFAPTTHFCGLLPMLFYRMVTIQVEGHSRIKLRTGVSVCDTSRLGLTPGSLAPA